MPLRASLLLKPPESEHIDRIREAAADIMARLSRGEDVGGRIASLKGITGHGEFDLDYFESLYSHSNIDEFAREAALPLPRVVPDLTSDELIDRTPCNDRWLARRPILPRPIR